MNTSFKLTLRVSWWMQVFQILFALPFTVGSFFMLISVFKGSVDTLIAFFLFAFFAYLGWANAFSTIQITDENVTVTVFYGRFRIRWDEVEKIIQNTAFIALLGNDKRVVLSLAFAGKNSDKVIQFLNQQIELRKILFEQDVKPFPLKHQNARIWRS